MHRLRSDRKCTEEDPEGQRDILYTATVLQGYTALRSILQL